MKTVKYGGIADAHGIESFIPADKMDWAMEMRVHSNRQRHAVLYQIECTQEFADELNRVLDGKPNKQGHVWDEDKRFMIALKKIKGSYANQSGVTDIGLAKGMEKSWKMIPNPDLDPWA